MDTASRVAIWVVAGLHVGFAVAEVFFWEKLTPPLKIYDAVTAKTTAPVGRNMGLYNAILAACLAWLLLATGLDDGHARSLAALLLLSIVIAGAFGGFTIKWTIPIFQSLPALIALGLVLRMTSK